MLKALNTNVFHFTYFGLSGQKHPVFIGNDLKRNVVLQKYLITIEIHQNDLVKHL